MRRTDANPIALRAIRTILGAAHDCEVPLANGVVATVEVESLPGATWPSGGLEGLDPETDGPWPPTVRMHYRWPGGEAVLRAYCYWWKTRDSYRHLVGIAVGLEGRTAEVAWVTLALPVRKTADGETAKVRATLGFNRHADQESPELWDAWRRSVRAQAEAIGLPRPTSATVDLCEIDVPSGEVLPSPEVAFTRLAQTALLKLTTLCRSDPEAFPGEPPFGPAALEVVEVPVKGEVSSDKRMGLWSLPGGVRSYADTLRTMLAFIAEAPTDREGVYGWLEEGFEVRGPTARQAYVNLLLYLGMLAEDDEGLGLTEAGERWLAEPASDALFEFFHEAYAGLLDMLVLVGLRGPLGSTGAAVLKELLGVSWKTDNQVSFRRNWLLSLGLTDRQQNKDTITEAGRAVLAAHPVEVGEVRARIDKLGQDPEEVAPADIDDVDELDTVDPTIGDAQLVLRPAQVLPYLGSFRPPARVIAQCCAALSSGRHLLLVGPPGTGKTVLAGILAQAAQSEGYCEGLRTTTASADWTTFDTIGGYALTREGKLRFRPGVFPRALEENRWLLVDELNRADVDKAFGELMTVLSGQGTTTPYEDAEGRPIHIGPEATAAYRVRPAFRVIATMNTWDKTSLFQLSSALQRRFATVHVGLPTAATYQELLEAEAARPPALAPDLAGVLIRLFAPDSLLAHRAVGPAVALDMLRHLRHCEPEQRASHGLAEAIAVSLLSQLEGLPHGSERAVFALFQGALEGVAAPEAWAELRQRLAELFTTLDVGP